MGGSSLAPPAAYPVHQPGEYRGAAALNMQNGSSLSASYGRPAAPQLSLADLPLTDFRSDGNSDVQPNPRQLSSASDALAAGSPLSNGLGGTAGPADHAATHSRSSSGWTGFDGPCYAFGSGLASAGNAAGAPPTDGNAAGSELHGSVMIGEQRQQQTSLHDDAQHSDLHLRLQRSSLADPSPDFQPLVCRLPFSVTNSLRDAVSTQNLQHSDSSGGCLAASFRTEEDVLPRELIGNLDLYL